MATPTRRNLQQTLLFTLLFSGCVSLREHQREAIEKFRGDVTSGAVGFALPPGARLDTVVVDSAARSITLRFNRQFGITPFRQENVSSLHNRVAPYFKEYFEGFTVGAQVRDLPVEALIPNYYRNIPGTIDSSRLPRTGRVRPRPVVMNVSKPLVPAAGLGGMNIALWHSHGWYFNAGEGRWEWQRPRLFQTVEDMVPMSFTLPYLIPMLENAGALVFVPRERDTQKNEVVVDNDRRDGYSESTGRGAVPWTTGPDPGFAVGTPPYPANHNPFHDGTWRQTTADTFPTGTATWIPDIPETGEYWVSVSFASGPENIEDAHYSVYHAGGRTDFRVNQRVGGGTWVYLGRFTFASGKNPGIGRVVLTNASATPGRRVTADAVRFGGGMGVVARNGRTSGKPKYLEGARYFLQYAGMPDTLVYNMNALQNDYNDDYVGRSEYVNFLTGAPDGPNKNRNHPGLGIPIDLSLAFHTDAGITRTDSVVGTLSIFSTEDGNSARVFPDSMSRLANRDFADILQTQIVEDIRALFDPAWRRRQLMDSRYSEATRTNVPSALLELLSHQNFLDMSYMLDPRFRFHVGRAIYKAMLRFLTFQNGRKAVVQPLPPQAFSVDLSGDGAQLRWAPTPDPLEPSAIPDRYILYTRVEEGGFDNGRIIEGTSTTIPSLLPGVLYSFRVTAANEGGESFPSEVLSACRTTTALPAILVVNGFDRVSGPRGVSTPTFSGFMNLLDAGIPDRVQLNFTGLQHDFDPASPWLTNDAPGHGASFADREGYPIMGNTFDFAAVHARALRANGYSSASCSREAVTRGDVDLKRYRGVDLILGEQRRTPWQKGEPDSVRPWPFAAFPAQFRAWLAEYLDNGGRLFLSGAYIASDPTEAARRDTTILNFITNRLHYRLSTGHAARRGMVYPIVPGFSPAGEFAAFTPEGDESNYGVEAPDALSPAAGGTLLLRYSENQFGAATGFKGDHGVVAFGFPFETILKPEVRNQVMGSVMGYLLGP